MNSSANARKATIVTGASEGIGAELARVFAEKGHEVVLVARRGDYLERLSREIAATGAPKPLVVTLDLCRVRRRGRAGKRVARGESDGGNPSE